MNRFFLFLLLIFIIFGIPLSTIAQSTLRVEGKDSTETEAINFIGYQKQHQNFLSIEKELDQLLLKIQKSGYIDAKLMHQLENDSVYTAIFHLNKKFENIKINYSTTKEEKKALQKWAIKISETNFVIPILYIEESLQQIIAIKTRKGDAFSSIQLSNIQKEGNNLSADLNPVSSEIRTIDGVIIEGYKKFPSSYTKHFLNIKTGQIFDKEKLLERANRTKKLSFVSQIKPPEVLFTKDSTIAYFYLRKENTNIFDGFLGFSNSEDNKLIFSGDLQLKLHNNLNFGERLQLQYRSNGEEQINFSTELELPFIFKSPISLVAGLNIFKQDSTFLNVNSHINAKYIFNSTTSTHIGYRSSSSTNLSSDNNQNNNIEDFAATFVTIGGVFENLDPESPLFPIRTSISLNLEAGNRISKTTMSQQVVSFNAIKNFFITPRSAFYIKNASNFLNSEEYLTNELFRFGGMNSLRGFLENSITANFFTSFQTEYRYILSPNLYAHTILDIAYFENNIGQQKEQLTGYGLGLGFNTKSGLLKVNLANGSYPNETFSFSNSKVHLSLMLHF